MPTHNAFTDQPETWWDPKGPFWTLHAINPLRLAFIKKHIQSGEALDIGCGGGILTEALAKSFSATGIDTDESLINIANSRASDANYQHIELRDFMQTQPSFNVVTCLEVLEHVNNPEQMVADIASIIKPSGFAFFSTLNRNPISFLGAIVAAEHIIKILPKNTHQYDAFIKPAELINWASAHGLILKDIKGILYNPLTKSFSIGQTTLINYIACFEKA